MNDSPVDCQNASGTEPQRDPPRPCSLRKLFEFAKKISRPREIFYSQYPRKIKLHKQHKPNSKDKGIRIHSIHDKILTHLLGIFLMPRPISSYFDSKGAKMIVRISSIIASIKFLRPYKYLCRYTGRRGRRPLQMLFCVYSSVYSSSRCHRMGL